MIEVDDGVRLRTWTTGSAAGHPPVLLLHGGPGLWDYLEPVARLLDPLTVVHRFDQRGCGGSDPSDEQSIARTVADIEALRDHWGHDSWIVAGHSFGANLAYAYAASCAGNTAALIYLSGTGAGDWRTDYHRTRAERMTPEQQGRLAHLESLPARSPADETEYRALSWCTDFADPATAWQHALADAATDLPINYAANRALTAETPDLLAQASHLTMPTWFIHGDRDPRPAHTVRTLAAAVPTSRFCLIEGAGHKPWVERPHELGGLLKSIVESGARTMVK
ncbi:alpha/beta fold hydrolase [Actinoplanes sp. NPDC051494]|uniref:alpha/beta fold hydrolase n=1 Tax=Actinoplanes sp. NPDC051494 TaxID=3363907 RepID=UPI0037A64543